MYRRNLLAIAFLMVLASFVAAQAPATSTSRPLSPTARLMAAKTAFLKNAGGSSVPFDVVSDSIQGWGRYQIVPSADQADITIEVTSPNDGNGVSVSTSTSTDPHTGMPRDSTTTTRELTVARITMTVYDSKSRMALFSASEQPKKAMRDKARKDNIVEAAEHLVSQFRARVEPDANK
jgi:hypothetical protein